MRAGATLHLQYEPSREWWNLSNGWTVPADVAAIVINHPCVASVGDTLFPDTRPRPGALSNRRRKLTMTEKPKLEVIENAVSDDPFDLAKLRVSQDFLETTNVKKLLTTVPIRKPGCAGLRAGASVAAVSRNVWRSSS